MTDGGLDGISAVALLDDDLRRRMYLLIRDRGEAVSRGEIAGELGVSAKLAAFHLEQMVERGLLKAHYARPPGRSGRGAGRSARYYEPSDAAIEVSVPERRYSLIGSLLVRALEGRGEAEGALDAATRVGRETGVELGKDVKRERRLRRVGKERGMTILRDVLGQYGYEPHSEDGELALRNCPFHELAKQHRELVCGLNHAFMMGILEGLGVRTLDASLTCYEGECCVRIATA